MTNRLITYGAILFSFWNYIQAQGFASPDVVIARVKYRGGGDWYNDPSAIPNLARFIKQNTLININDQEAQIELMDESLFAYPILFLTGHGQLSFNDTEAERLRCYLLRGGFLYVDDDYGLDKDFRRALKQIFPNRELVELPFSHDIYRTPFRFENGLPKIHEHDNKPAQGFGIFDDQQRLMIFYTYECNLSDGWTDPQMYNDPPEKREASLKMGTNIILWALIH
ncbi:DUF4159 domain-containing protein [bacterium]|nr:DUF4159 domain-containing protein [bacterium]